MNSLKICLAASLLIGASLFGRAQSTGPAVDLSGTWQVDTYLSDDPRQVEAAIRFALNERVEGSPEGERGQGGRGGDRQGQNGRRGRGRGSSAEQAPSEDQRRLDEMMRRVRRSPVTLEISQTATSATLKDELGQSYTFKTDVKNEKQTFGSVTIETAAHWEGPQLVIDFDLPRGLTMTYTYSIVPTTEQLLWRVSFQKSQLDVAPFVIKQLYNRAKPQ